MKSQKGQVALLLVLIVTVASTVVLSVVSGVVQNLRVTSVDEQSAQALRVAEGGAEEALRALAPGTITDQLGGLNYTVTTVAEGQNGFLTAGDVLEGEVVEIDLRGAVTRPTSIDVFWGENGDPQELPVGAVEIIHYRRYTASDIRAFQRAFDPDGTRAAGNGFNSVAGSSGSFGGASFLAMTNVSVASEDRLIRIRAVYNQMRIGVAPRPAGSGFGKMAYNRITSTAQTAEGVTRKVEVTRSEEVLPGIFDAALYSGESL